MSAKGVGKPNIALILADNLGWGELGCYGGGTLRGAPTPRSDRLAEEGLRLTNFNVESDCVPTRAALMMGRHAIRTGALQSLPQGVAQGLTRWEVLLPDLLKQQGYKTALFGKWHLGDTPERLPNARGFDEWYGLPRTLNEAYFATTVGYDPGVGPRPYLMEGKAGEDTVNLGELNLETRRLIDAEVVDRSIRFMEASVAEGSPFFLYAPTTQMHFPNLAHPDFTGVTGFGEMADSLAELDFRVGQILDAIDALGVRQDTVIIFASDNGPEFRDPWRGTAGYWRGTYHTAMEGGLRAPAILRWPGRIRPGRVSDEIVHVADLYTTLATVADACVPVDRPIDGLDQSAFLFEGGKSAREGLVGLLHQERPARGQMAQLEVPLLLGAGGEPGQGQARVPVAVSSRTGPERRDGCFAAEYMGVRSDHENGRCVHAESRGVLADPAGYAGPLRPARAYGSIRIIDIASAHGLVGVGCGKGTRRNDTPSGG